MRQFFSLKNLWNRRGKFRQTSHYFFVKSLKSYCSQSKNKEIDKYSNKFFSEIRSSGDFWIQIGQPYQKVLGNKLAPIIAWNSWMWSADFKQKSLPKPLFGWAKCIIENPARNLSLTVQKVVLEVGKIGEFGTSKNNFFHGVHPLDT